MRSNAERLLIAAVLAGAMLGAAPATAATQAAPLPPGAPTADEPPVMPPPRYDTVGYASWTDAAAGSATAAHASLPPGSFVEVTSLDTGKTIVVAVSGTAPAGREIALSGAAAQALGLSAGMPGGVRVRAVNPVGTDLTALQAGQAVVRADTPPVLLNPLRRKLGALPTVRPARAIPGTSRPLLRTRPTPQSAIPVPTVLGPPPATRPTQPVRAGYHVQVAALANQTKAAALARTLGGTVVAGGGFFRVRTGPYADARQAQAARDGLARRGYGDARIVRPD